MATPRASITPAAESALWPLVLAALPERGAAYTNGVPSEWIWRLVQRPSESGDWALQRMADAGLLVRIDGAGGPWWRKVVGAVLPAPVDQFGGLANGAVLRVIDGSKNVEGQMPVATSAGAADAGKLPQLDADGKLDSTLLPSSLATDAEVAAAIAAHEAAGDPHPGYATDGDVTTVAGDLVAHVAASNPHTGAQPLDALLTAIAALTTVADRLIYCTGVDTVALTTFTAAARTFAAAVDAAAQRTAMGLGTASTQNVGLGPLGTSITTDRLIGRDTTGTGVAEQLTVSGGVEFSGSGGIRRSALTGDVTASAGNNATTIAANAVSNTKLRDSAALSLIGRSANSVGDPGDIVGAANGVCRVSSDGTTLGFGAIVTQAIAGITTDRLIGRDTAGTGAAEEISVGGGLEFTGAAAIRRGALSGVIEAAAGSGSTTWAWWKANAILANPTGDTAAPVLLDALDVYGLLDAVFGSSYLIVVHSLATQELVSIAL